MSAIDRTVYGLSGVLPIVPSFDFDGAAEIHAPAAWEYMEAMLDYEANIRPIAHDWSIDVGKRSWAAKRPWFCSF